MASTQGASILSCASLAPLRKAWACSGERGVTSFLGTRGGSMASATPTTSWSGFASSEAREIMIKDHATASRRPSWQG